MKRIIKTRIILAMFLLLGILGVQSFAPQGANFIAAQAAPQADINAPEVKNLSEAKKISATEAQKRITWQNRAADLNDQLQQSMPTNRFAGVWIDENNDRVKVGVVGGLPASDPQKKMISDKITANAIADATDVVTFKYSSVQLDEALDWITDRLADANRGSQSSIQVEISPNENKVILTIPVADSQMTKAQDAFFKAVQKRYGDMIGVTRRTSKGVKESCNWNYCNNPLRGGIPLHSNLGGNYSYTVCTAGFIVKGRSGEKYILTAGHCEEGGSGWGTLNTNGDLKKIGPIKSKAIYHGGDGHDGMTIDIRDSYNWSAKGWIFMRKGLDYNGVSGPTRNEEYDITGKGTALKGQRVCKSGAVYGASCGVVKSPSTSFDFGNGTITKGLVRAEYCSDHGDSGAPVVRSHLALGLHVIADDANGADCTPYKYYAAIGPIFKAFADEVDQHYSVF